MVAELSLRVGGGPDAPAEARKALRRAHPELPLEMRQTVGLLASELVSNAVRHAGADSVAIRFQVVPTHIRVEVADDGPGFDVATRRVGQPGRAGGWGLRLVDELASRWGVADGERHTVWFEIDRV